MKPSIASLIMASLFPCVGSAAVVVTTDSQTNGSNSLPHTYLVSSTDLINGLAPSASSGNFAVTDFEGQLGDTGVLTNGSFPSPITRPSSGAFQTGAFTAGGNGAGTSVTYTLTTAATIASIDVFGGWQDGGRDQQSYSVLTSTDGLIFNLLQTVDFNPAPQGSNPIATKTTISDTTGTLATNVLALRFDFNATENDYSGYSEIDVNAVPEPSAALLGGLGLLGLLIRRRK